MVERYSGKHRVAGQASGTDSGGLISGAIIGGFVGWWVVIGVLVVGWPWA